MATFSTSVPVFESMKCVYVVSNLSASSPLSCPLGFWRAFFPIQKKDWVWGFSYSSRSSYK